mmetsp:Transcript_43512/g.78205  ORF Transcript_43512/g.78205 Transcript_43512/m.78205 type:complete len:484 (-) Transcript_43512:681-2132(-)
MGFERSLFVDPPADTLCCAICAHVLEKPVQCKNGHIFCEDCITFWLIEKEQCPSCRCELTIPALSRQLLAQDLILALRVRCRYSAVADGQQSPKAPAQQDLDVDDSVSSDGCDWEGVLAKLDQHLKECVHVLVQCPAACGASVPRGMLEEHHEVCPQRLEDCQHCRKQMLASDVEDHIAQTCPAAEVTCDCGARFLRQQLPNHQATECPTTLVDCPYAAQGCTQRPQRAHLLQHLADYGVQHVQLSHQALLAVRNELQSFKDQMVQRLSGVEARNTELEQIVAELRLQQRQLDFNTAKEIVGVEWIVSDFVTRLAVGKSVYSQRFYVLGYEMAMRIRFDVDEKRIGFYFKHMGGSTAMPVNIGGSTITIKGIMNGEEHAVTRKAFETKCINKENEGVGWNDLLRFTDLTTLGLLVNGQLHVSASLVVAKQTVRRLATHGDPPERESSSRVPAPITLRVPNPRPALGMVTPPPKHHSRLQNPTM